MKIYQGERDYEHGRATRIGVLLCNLGTPDEPTAKAVRRYLGEFLSDPRVVELPRALWLPILHGIILRVRPKRSAAAYAEVWREDGSPLMAISKRQASAIAAALETALPERTEVVLAMRYGTPSIAAGLRHLREANVRNVLVFPLYPQYAAATTASVFDAVATELSTWRWIPSIRFIHDYHADPAYIEALAASVTRSWAKNGRADHLLMSFHGTPKAALLAGDPYHCHCHATARLLAEKLELDNSGWELSFQSRFGRAEWLQPYTENTLKRLAAEGIKKVDVICPGFSADCLETLEEIALQYAKVFVAAGGESLNYIPALNDDVEHIDALVNIIQRNIAGWPESAPDWDATIDAKTRVASARRAGDMKNPSATGT